MPGMVDDNDNLELYDGRLRFADAEGDVVVNRMPAHDYAKYIGEATVPHSFLKAPYFKPGGFPEGDLPRRSARPSQRRGALRHAKRRTPNSLNITSALARWCRARSTTTTPG